MVVSKDKQRPCARSLCVCMSRPASMSAPECQQLTESMTHTSTRQAILSTMTAAPLRAGFRAALTAQAETPGDGVPAREVRPIASCLLQDKNYWQAMGEGERAREGRDARRERQVADGTGPLACMHACLLACLLARLHADAHGSRRGLSEKPPQSYAHRLGPCTSGRPGG